MRILTYGLSTDKLAGIETFVLNMNRFMPADIIFDYIIEAKAGIPMEKQDTIHRAAIEERGGKMLFIAPKRDIFRNILDWNKLLKEQKTNSDIVYFNLYSLAWIVPICMAKMHGYHVVLHAHNNNLHDCGKLQRLMHGVFRQFQKVLHVTRLTNSHLSTEFFFDNKEAEMIYNAVDTSRFRFDPQNRERIRRERNVQDKHVYGFAGRIAFQKNPEFLMDIFAEIKKLDDQAAFIVCGDGDLMEETQQRAKQLGVEVHFCGACPNVQDYYSAMDMFVLPSRFEGLGIVLIEAQCCGLPSVTSADVVPMEAKVTELLDYISLEKPASDWAALCVEKLNKAGGERIAFSEIVAATNYEIRREAVRLGKILSAR